MSVIAPFLLNGVMILDSDSGSRFCFDWQQFRLAVYRRSLPGNFENDTPGIFNSAVHYIIRIANDYIRIELQSLYVTAQPWAQCDEEVQGLYGPATPDSPSATEKPG